MIEIIMPKLGLTMEGGTIAQWLKHEGEEIEKGEPLFVVETDKATADVEAPASGTLGKIWAYEGEMALVAQVIGYILAFGEQVPDEWPSPVEAVAPTLAAAGPKPQAIPASTSTPREGGISLAQVGGADEAGVTSTEDVMRLINERPAEMVAAPPQTRANPRVRRLAQQKGVSLAKIEGSGPGGRITEQDVLDSLASKELLTPSPIQRITAERMSKSFATVPHFYLTVEAKATRLVAWRERLVPIIENEAGVHLTFTDILILLVAKALQNHPLANASWEEGRIRISKEINVGLAATVEQGLLTPVIRTADQKSLSEIARERFELVGKAAKGKLSLEELEGGTFTLTNLGMYGVDEFGAIINPPQSAILAVGSIAERVVVEEGKVVAMPTIRLTLSLDHRVLGGVEGARLLKDLKALIEEAGEFSGNL